MLTKAQTKALGGSAAWITYLAVTGNNLLIGLRAYLITKLIERTWRLVRSSGEFEV